MDSLALPSVASNRASLREELEALPTDTLKKQLSNTLGLTARHLMRLAVIVAVLEDRGEDLSALKNGFLSVLRKIATGELLPDLVVLFAADPHKIQTAAKLPVEEQREILSGRRSIPDRKRSSTRSSGSVGRIPEPTAGCNAPNPLRNIAAAGNPRDVAETAAELVLACKNPSEAAAFLIAALERAGVSVGESRKVELPKPPPTRPPGYWLDRTKFDEADSD